MKKIILFILLTTVSAVSLALPPVCQKLRDLTNQGEADYDVLSLLQFQCRSAIFLSPEKPFYNQIKKLDVSKSLSEAHTLRLNERQVLSEDLRNSISFLSSSSPSHIILLDDSFFGGSLADINKLKAHLQALKNKPLTDYLDQNMNSVLNKDLSSPDFSNDIKNILNVLKGKVQDYGAHSNALLAPTDRILQTALDNALATISNLRNRANYQATVRVNDDIMASLSNTVLKLKASNSWGQFTARSGINNLIFAAQVKINMGLIDSGRETLEAAQHLLDNFRSSLGTPLKNEIDANYSPSVTNQITKYMQLAQSMPEAQIENRLVGFINYKSPLYKNSHDECLKTFPSETTRLNSIDEDLAHVSNVASISDVKGRLFVYSSLAEKLDIAVDLCQGTHP